MAAVYRSVIASRSRGLLRDGLGFDAAEIPSVRRLVSRMRLAKVSRQRSVLWISFTETDNFT